MPQQKIRIRLKGYDHQQVDKSARDIVDTAQRTGATITGPVPLPTEKNVYCVIRSPVQGQGLAGALRDPHAQAADRHPLADAEDGRLAHAARPPGRRRHRDQALAMKGIVGRKLGMTQVFDEESGVVTLGHRDRGGPVPGRRRAHAGRRRLRGRAARVRARRRPQDLEGRARPPREERRRRRVPPPRRVPRPLLATRCRARASRSRSSSPATRSRSRASAIGKGFQGTIKRHSFHRGPTTHGSHNIRKPGSIGASATPSRVFKGMKMAGQHGRQARHAGRPHRPLGRRRAQPAARQGRRARARRTASSRSGRCELVAAPKAPVLGGDEEGRLARRGRLRRRDQAASRARGRARRAERAPPGHARGEEPRARLRRPREAVAPEGHRPRAPGHDPRAAVHGRRRRVPADAARLRREGEQEGVEGRAALARSPTTRRPARSALARRVDVRRAVDEGTPPSCSPTWGKDDADASSSSREDEESARRSRSATSTACSSRVPSELEVAQVVWARSLLVSEAALDAVQGRAVDEPASERGADPRPWSPRRATSRSRRTSTRSRCTRTRTRRRSARPSRSSSTSRWSA